MADIYSLIGILLANTHIHIQFRNKIQVVEGRARYASIGDGSLVCGLL